MPQAKGTKHTVSEKVKKANKANRKRQSELIKKAKEYEELENNEATYSSSESEEEEEEIIDLRKSRKAPSQTDNKESAHSAEYLDGVSRQDVKRPSDAHKAVPSRPSDAQRYQELLQKMEETQRAYLERIDNLEKKVIAGNSKDGRQSAQLSATDRRKQKLLNSVFSLM